MHSLVFAKWVVCEFNLIPFASVEYKVDLIRKTALQIKSISNSNYLKKLSFVKEK